MPETLHDLVERGRHRRQCRELLDQRVALFLGFGLGIERDLWFEGRWPISVYAQAARQAGRIVESGPELDEAARGRASPVEA
ncbi:MAG: DUF2958 domain-containing protein [Rhodospirillaceae bacterium]|nr:DUF2958 domain-containing protein [Rhodospirillaceae bacterium]